MIQWNYSLAAITSELLDDFSKTDSLIRRIWEQCCQFILLTATLANVSQMDAFYAHMQTEVLKWFFSKMIFFKLNLKIQLTKFDRIFFKNNIFFLFSKHANQIWGRCIAHQWKRHSCPTGCRVSMTVL